jgi:hypothetical protein
MRQARVPGGRHGPFGRPRSSPGTDGGVWLPRQVKGDSTVDRDNDDQLGGLAARAGRPTVMSQRGYLFRGPRNTPESRAGGPAARAAQRDQAGDGDRP